MKSSPVLVFSSPQQTDIHLSAAGIRSFLHCILLTPEEPGSQPPSPLENFLQFPFEAALTNNHIVISKSYWVKKTSPTF